MDAFKKNLTDLGTKLKDGAADFAQKHEGEINAVKAKAEELKAMAEGALGGGSKKTGEETAEKKSSIISNWKPGINVEEGSIADILFKAKASGGAEEAETVAAPAEPVEPVAQDETAPKESYPGDVAMDEIQKEVIEIAARLEAFGNDVKDNEDVQKVLVPLLTKLSLAQEKFVSATSKTEEATSEQAAEEPAEEETAEDNDEGKLPSYYAANDLKYQAEKAAKKALEDAEAIAKAVAVKIGILEGSGGKEKDAADETEVEPKAAPEEEK